MELSLKIDIRRPVFLSLKTRIWHTGHHRRTRFYSQQFLEVKDRKLLIKLLTLSIWVSNFQTAYQNRELLMELYGPYRFPTFPLERIYPFWIVVDISFLGTIDIQVMCAHQKKSTLENHCSLERFPRNHLASVP